MLRLFIHNFLILNFWTRHCIHYKKRKRDILRNIFTNEVYFFIVCLLLGIIPCGWTIREGEIHSTLIGGRTSDRVWGIWLWEPLRHFWVSVLDFLVWWFLEGDRSKQVNYPLLMQMALYPVFARRIEWQMTPPECAIEIYITWGNWWIIPAILPRQMEPFLPV